MEFESLKLQRWIRLGRLIVLMFLRQQYSDQNPFMLKKPSSMRRDSAAKTTKTTLVSRNKTSRIHATVIGAEEIEAFYQITRISSKVLQTKVF